MLHDLGSLAKDSTRFVCHTRAASKDYVFTRFPKR